MTRRPGFAAFRATSERKDRQARQEQKRQDKDRKRRLTMAEKIALREERATAG